MIRGRLGILVVASALAVRAQSPHPIDMRHPTDPAQYAFLGPIIDSAEVVALGESLHLTSEFPLVRIGIIRYLNANHGFGVVALEGSAGDVWVAQDILLNSKGSQADAEAALRGFFPIWNTGEMRQLVE